MSTTRLALISLILLPFFLVTVAEQILAQPVKKDRTKNERAIDTEPKPSIEEPTLTDEQRANRAKAGGVCCGFGLLTVAVGGIAALLFYFLPTFIGLVRGHPNMMPILVVNFLLGWTLVGYVVSLAWALTAIDSGPKRTRRRGSYDD